MVLYRLYESTVHASANIKPGSFKSAGAIQKCWPRLYSDLSHCTLFHFAPCMDMHGLTLYSRVYIYTKVSVRIALENWKEPQRPAGSKRLKKAQKGARGLEKALEEAARACPVPPVRPKRLFEPALVPPACAFEEAVRDCCSRSLFESAGLGYTVL